MLPLLLGFLPLGSRGQSPTNLLLLLHTVPVAVKGFVRKFWIFFCGQSAIKVRYSPHGNHPQPCVRLGVYPAFCCRQLMLFRVISAGRGSYIQPQPAGGFNRRGCPPWPPPIGVCRPYRLWVITYICRGGLTRRDEKEGRVHSRCLLVIKDVCKPAPLSAANPPLLAKETRFLIPWLA